MNARFAALAGLFLLLLGGCYLPADFEVDINIDDQGRYAFRYKGDILALNLLKRISKGDVTAAINDKGAAVYKRDLARDSGFKKVEYLGRARFRVLFERQGDIRRDKSFNFVRSNSRYLAINLRKDGRVEVVGDRPPKRYVDELIERGFDVRGVLRVWTSTRVVRQNATRTRPGSPALYEWSVKSMRDPSPKIILELR